MDSSIKNTKLKFGSRKFYSLLFSSTIGMVIAAVVSLSDTIIAGQFGGETSAAAINLVYPLFAIIAFFASLVDIGTFQIYSFEMGRFNKARADKIFGQGLILTLSGGVLLLLLIYFGRELFFSTIQVSEELLIQAKAYYKCYTFIAILFPLSDFLSTAVFNDGDELLSTASNIAQVVSNIVLSIVLYKYFGIVGIGLGTLIGSVLSIIISLTHFLRKSNSLRFAWHFSAKDIFRVFRYGITDAETSLYCGAMLYFMNSFVSNAFGSEFIPVLTVCAGVYQMTIIFDGIGQAFTPLVNVYLGEKNNLGIRDVMKTAQIVAIAEGLVATAILMIFAPFVPKIYGIDPGEMTTFYTTMIRIFAVTLVFASLKFAYSSYYVAKEKLFISSGIVFLSDFVFPLAVGIPLSKMIGINGLWIGLASAPLISLAVVGLITGAVYGIRKLPLLLDFRDDDTVISYDIALTSESIVKLRDAVEIYLKKYDIDEKTAMHAMLMVEECCLRILGYNKGKTVYLQCSVFMGDNKRIILSDSGKIFDITDVDMQVDSMNAFVVSMLMQKCIKKQNLTTLGYNRNEITLEYNIISKNA